MARNSSGESAKSGDVNVPSECRQSSLAERSSRLPAPAINTRRPVCARSPPHRVPRHLGTLRPARPGVPRRGTARREGHVPGEQPGTLRNVAIAVGANQPAGKRDINPDRAPTNERPRRSRARGGPEPGVYEYVWCRVHPGGNPRSSQPVRRTHPASLGGECDGTARATAAGPPSACGPAKMHAYTVGTDVSPCRPLTFRDLGFITGKLSHYDVPPPPAEALRSSHLSSTPTNLPRFSAQRPQSS